MARPIQPRNSQTFERDIAALRRTRTAIQYDANLDKKRAAVAISRIDDCIRAIIELAGTLPINA